MCFAAFTSEPMWLGLMHNDNACSSPADCSEKDLFHHEPGMSASQSDDIMYRFFDGGHVNVPMNFDQGQFCGAIEGAYSQPPNQHQNEILSKGCGESAPFVCTATCLG